jgi:hypothetical protein
MLSAEDTSPQGSISGRAANPIPLLHPPAEGSFLEAEKQKTHPPTPGVTQKLTGLFWSQQEDNK